MKDTLEVRNPHDEMGKRGSTQPTPEEVRLFIQFVFNALKPFAKRLGTDLLIDEIPTCSISAFRFIVVGKKNAKAILVDSRLEDSILEIAERTGSSRIVRKERDVLVVGILNQYRYWTLSRARLLAADILGDYFSVFDGGQ